MEFTALHRLLGLSPGPLTDDMIDDAVAQQVAETDDLDFKDKLPPKKKVFESDFPKDVAAMANTGGGVLVFGVEEVNKAAVKRCDAGELDENWERTLRRAAITAISPPIFGLKVSRLGETNMRAVAVVVPASIDGPHLIYRGEYFGAPVRNDADTEWMKERQIEARYRARFDERRHSAEALTSMYEELAAGRDIEAQAWVIAVARPRISVFRQSRMTRDEASSLFDRGGRQALVYADRGGFHPLEFVDWRNPRPGLRRWVAPNRATAPSAIWAQSQASIHDDGSVGIVARIGGQLNREEGYDPGNRVNSPSLEGVIADLLGLVRAVSGELGAGEYETRVGIEWSGEPLVIQTVDGHGFPYDGESLPLARYSHVTTTIDTTVDDDGFFEQVRDLALDCVNQGGIVHLQKIRPS
ncbi:ATP-binding protein [Nocardia wallacei]|uniref:ATP-binding protein n=1 Tax=Nocardia wallacei TaxID=480035 RepID=UPI002456B276|nr:ATP-binding protein [Nocardia wallacei]